MVVFPTLIFFLFWIQGYQTAKKKELEKNESKRYSINGKAS